MATHEQTINVALGEVLGGLRPHSWHVHAEETRTLRNSAKRPDVLIEEAALWPVVIEAESESHAGAEADATARLGQIVRETGRPIESAIALVYPPDVRSRTQSPAIRQALRETGGLEYALYTRTLAGGEERLPASGWLQGSVVDLAMLAHRASTPAPRVDRLGNVLEQGANTAAHRFTKRHGSHAPGELGPEIAKVLEQADDQGGQTRRMAMTVLINALIFHEALHEADFLITSDSGQRRLAALSQFRDGPLSYRKSELLEEWERILERNYWPIFATAKNILGLLPLQTTGEILNALWSTTEQLVQGGVTKSHDLTGVIFQRLIADRKFLATYYTRPAAAALLAGLAIPADHAPGGAEWGDEETIAALQIGDFACGTGTLLSAAYQRISLLHELHGGDPRSLHAPMMKNGLVGLDVLNIAVHLTATMLAAAHPDVPFDGECLLTMPYGGESASIGSLELLARDVQPSLIEEASATTSGGRRPEDVADLRTRVGHDGFDLVIMNPPFTRPTNHEGQHRDVPNPAYSAFETTAEEQAEMSRREKVLTKGSAAAGNAGMAALFAELAQRKRNADGSLAFVLPLSSMSGSSWNRLRQEWRTDFADTTVVTIAAEGSFDRSFSADTGIAECLVIHKADQLAQDEHRRGWFVVLRRIPASLTEAEQLGVEILKAQCSDQVRSIEDGGGVTTLQLGETTYGTITSIALPTSGPWTLCGILDLELAQAAYQLSTGRFRRLGEPGAADLEMPVVRAGSIAERGPVHRDINGVEHSSPGGTNQVRGPFDIQSPATSPMPTYPTLWAHKAMRERRLVVAPDSEGRLRASDDNQEWLSDKAADIWKTATRTHYNLDLRFNSQSLIVAMTGRKCIGGRAWPSVILHNPEHEYAFSLWCNSTLGLLLHWWVSNKGQAGRGTTTVTGIPNIPTLDTRALSDAQHAEAKRQFDLLRNELFLPFDQIDEDPARAKLDRAILVKVLGLPESLVAPDGPIDLIRRKLAREPQIHGGKKSRVVFTDEGEKRVKRDDR